MSERRCQKCDTPVPADALFCSRCGVDVTVVDDPDCIALMARFIKERPELWHEDIAAP